MATQQIRQDQIGSLVAADGVSLAGADDLAFAGSGTSLPAGWSSYNSGGTMVTEDNGRLVFKPTVTNYLRGFHRTLPVGFVSMTVRFSGLFGANGIGFGLYLRDSATDKKVHFSIRGDSNCHLTYWNAGDSATPSTATAYGWGGGTNAVDFYMRIKKNSSSSWDFQSGPALAAWLDSFMAQNVPTATGGFTPDQIGFMAICQSAGPLIAAIDYFKFT